MSVIHYDPNGMETVADYPSAPTTRRTGRVLRRMCLLVEHRTAPKPSAPRALNRRRSGGLNETRLRLDLFCGAGGAAMGYHRAGFDVVGVDIKPQPNYPFDFHQGDAMTWPLDGYDAIHASPPCHDHSTITGRNRKAAGAKGTGWMLAATITRLRASGRPWIVENVGTARFPADVPTFRLCGSSFGLDVQRHRLFASDTLRRRPRHPPPRPGRFPVARRQPAHRLPARAVGVPGTSTTPARSASYARPRWASPG